MLTALTVENFKCFGKRTHIPLAPITLIYGQNSAGKSAVLQMLSLLKQSLERADNSACLVPRCENGLVDLGSYENLIHKHEPSRDLTFRIDCEEPTGGRGMTCRGFGDLIACGRVKNAAGYEVTIGPAAIPGERRAIHVKRIAIHNQGASSPEFVFERRTPCSNLPQDTIEVPNNPMLGGLVTEEFFDQDEYRLFASQALDREHPDKAFALFWSDEAKAAMADGIDQYKAWCSRGSRREEYEELKTFYGSELGGKAEEFVARYGQARFLPKIDLNSFIPTQTHLELPLEDRLLLLGFDYQPHGHVYGDERYIESGALPEPVGATVEGTRMARGEPTQEAQYVTRVGGLVRGLLTHRLRPLAPIRSEPERWHMLQMGGRRRESVGYRGELTLDVLASDVAICEGVSKWLKILTNYSCTVKTIRDAGPECCVLELRDELQGPNATPVTAVDVGYGISQLLPIITQCVAAENMITTIEQPEVHVHPKLQAELGDLFAQSYKKNGNQFIVETHSEHLLLRVRRLVRNGTLKPSDVSLLYVERGAEGSTVTPLKINSRGVITDPWPEGFFPDRLDEILGE